MPIERVIAYIDGYNLHYGLIEARLQTSRWLDLRAMCGSLMKAHQQLDLARYFTTRVRNNRDSARRQALFIDAVEALGGVELDYGSFLSKRTQCYSCGAKWVSNEEKKTDVNIAVRLLEDAYDGRFDTALIVSGDSDLVPAVQSVRSNHPDKRVVIAFPPKRHSSELQKVADAYFNISRQTILSSHLPATVTTPSGHRVTAPSGWLPSPAN